LDEKRAQALKEAVTSGGAASMQDAVESALDAWLAERALSQASDEILRRLWDEGVASGSAGALNFAELKAQARKAP
ncbi:MAG TPA: hypothetical protein PLS69_12340, partial [Terricaulis sp.]|nr:hypothetical protein [Terricaulis sp.]